MKPYETIQELLNDSKIHGPYIQSEYSNGYYLATQIYPVGIENESDFLVMLDSNPYNIMSPLELFEHFTWQDGSTCGKNEND